VIANTLRFLRGTSGFASVAQTGVTTLLVLALQVVTGIVCARVLGADGRGELAALLLAPQILSFLFTLGLPASLIFNARQRPERAADLVGTALLLSAVAGVAAVAAGYVALPRLLTQYSPATIRTAQLLLAFIVLGVASTVLVAALQLRGRFLVFNRMRLWQSVLVLAALTALAASGALDPTLGALAYLVPTLPFFVWNVRAVRRDVTPTLGAVRRDTAALLGYGLRAHGIDAVGTLLMQLDKLILIGVLAPSAFGVYVVVFNLSRLITTFAASVVPVLLPRVVGRPIAEVLTLTSRALGATWLLTLLAVGGFALLGMPLLALLYGHEFASGYPVLLLLAAEAALASAASILQQPYMALDRAGTVTLYQTASLAIAVVLVYVLALHFGAVGAAAGLLAATAVRVFLTLRGFRTLLGVDAPRLVPDRQECTLLLARLKAQWR
jgi:O-antigen/teichoic acid export membrane protein